MSKEVAQSIEQFGRELSRLQMRDFGDGVSNLLATQESTRRLQGLTEEGLARMLLCKTHGRYFLSLEDMIEEFKHHVLTGEN